jgi:cytochrome c553
MSSLDLRHPHLCTRVRASRSISAIVATLVWSGLRSALAADTDTANEQYARQLAIAVCASCHGPRGNSEQPKYPRLAGQSTNYLIAQLRNFRAQTRGDSDAISYMWGMAAELSDDSIEALAKYYAGQHPIARASSNSAEIARGREIYLHGIESQGVPACASCHGTDARGTADFPRLAGQHAQYILKQLGAFQSNMRNVAVMHGVAQNLRLAEMQTVATYLAAQP